ncbi:MAG TPA: hypothetical protein VIQ74_00115 [Gemmatimonadaceae bacterium]
MELVVAFTLMAILLGIVMPGLGTLRDRAAVRSAATEVAAMLASTRRAAMLRSTGAALVLDPERASATVVAGPDTLLARGLGTELGVRLAATRDTVRYAPSGRAWGASNTTLIVQRGRAADTLWVSRLGRVRD